MDSRPIRASMREGYFREYIQNRAKKGDISNSDANLLASYISKRVINEHIAPSNRVNLAVNVCQFKIHFLHGVEFVSMTTDNWEQAISELLVSDYKDSSKNAIIQSVRLFFTWCIESGKITNLGLKDVKSVKTYKKLRKTKTEKDFISPEEVYKMLSYSNISPKVSAIVAILYWTGCRLGEALNLKWCDLEFNPPVLEVRIPPFKVNPERYVPTAEALPFVANWRNHYPPEIVGGAYGDNYVFVSKYRDSDGYKKMTAQAVYYSIQDLSEKTIGRKVHPHQFRASDITNKSKMGVSDMANKMIHWGHVGTNMLEVYSIPNKGMIREEVMRASGLQPLDDKAQMEKPITCPICHKVNIGVNFCSNCGAPISRSAVEEKAAVAEESARINRTNNTADMLFVAAEMLGIDKETALKKLIEMLKKDT